MDIDTIVKLADEQALNVAGGALRLSNMSESGARKILDSMKDENPTIVARAKEFISRFKGTTP